MRANDPRFASDIGIGWNIHPTRVSSLPTISTDTFSVISSVVSISFSGQEPRIGTIDKKRKIFVGLDAQKGIYFTDWIQPFLSLKKCRILPFQGFPEGGMLWPGSCRS